MSYISYVHLYADEDGNSHFEDVQIETPHKTPLGFFSDQLNVDKMVFRHSLPSSLDWQPALMNMYIIYLSGTVKVETSSGEERIFKTGDILFCTDLKGRGHRTTVLEEGAVVIVTQ